MNIELYIGDRLCDIGNPENLGIYLKRVFIKPSELSVKDAQKSYEISLPATATNNEIFNYTNVEEVQGKFKVYDKARLYIDGILILDGKFRMSQITRDAYIGNLGVPAAKTVKDIFGETMMNQAGKWLIPFEGVQSITDYNTGKYETGKYGDNAPCIFPLVLYGLLPKYSSNNNYSAKNVYDDSVRLKLNDFPPSVNVIHMLQKIFDNAKYKLTGSAITDERLKNLYVSYKNPNNYEQEWNSQKIEISGSWGKYKNNHTESKVFINEFKVDTGGQFGPATWEAANINLLKADNKKIDYDISNPYIESTSQGIKLIIPHTGLYKLIFNAKIKVIDEHVSWPTLPNLIDTNFEIKVVRHWDDENLQKEKLDNSFYKDNQIQEYKEPQNSNIFPQEGNVNFIDPKQNANLLCGLAWGVRGSNMYINPVASNKHNPMAIKNGPSWSSETSFMAYSAVNSQSYINRQGTPVNKYSLTLEGAPKTKTNRTDSQNGDGQIAQIVWLEKDEPISIISSSFYEMSHDYWFNHSIEFSLSLEPFMDSKGWIAIDGNGNSNTTRPLKWNDTPTFYADQIDLIKHLPSNIKINDWIDNFCKTFNLELVNTANTTFELNVKNDGIPSNVSNPINLDNKANIEQRTNESLKLPSVYELGFTVDTGEEGYYRSMERDKNNDPILNSGQDGSGKYYTGSGESNVLRETSGFSYCWYKDIFDNKGNLFASVPVITNHEIWDVDYGYEEMKDKEYYDQAQRFWYKNGVLDIVANNTLNIKAAQVSNEYKGVKNIILDYENRSDSIMRNFFLIFANSSNNYTTVSCYLTAEEYNRLKYSLIKFNGDLYYVAEADGYNPMDKNKCTLKLIRMIE